MKYFCLILSFFLNSFSCTSQSENSFKEVVHTINIDLINSNELFKIVEKNYLKGELINSKFLGSVTDELGNVFYIINTIHIIVNENKNRTNENFLMIYSDSEFKGHYYLSTTEQLPNKIEKNTLIFFNACDDNIIELNFKNGIPYVLSLNCNNIADDYEFIRNN